MVPRDLLKCFQVFQNHLLKVIFDLDILSLFTLFLTENFWNHLTHFGTVCTAAASAVAKDRCIAHLTTSLL